MQEHLFTIFSQRSSFIRKSASEINSYSGTSFSYPNIQKDKKSFFNATKKNTKGEIYFQGKVNLGKEQIGTKYFNEITLCFGLVKLFCHSIERRRKSFTKLISSVLNRGINSYRFLYKIRVNEKLKRNRTIY